MSLQELIARLAAEFGPEFIVLHPPPTAVVLLQNDSDRRVEIGARDEVFDVAVKLRLGRGTMRGVDSEAVMRILQGHLLLHVYDHNTLDVDLFPCPCCGHFTYDEPASGTYAICEVCNWEDDAVQLMDPTLAGGANTTSLEQARTRFRATERLPNGELLSPHPRNSTGRSDEHR